MKIGTIVRNKLKSPDELFQIQSVDDSNPAAIFYKCYVLNENKKKIIKKVKYGDSRGKGPSHVTVLIRKKNLENV